MTTELSTSASLLRDELTRRIRVNPRYSLRAFAQHLQVSPGELSEILRGKRKLSLKNAAQIAQRLGYSPEERERFLQVIFDERTGALVQELQKGALSSPEKNLTVDVFRIVSDWYCPAIVCLAETPGFREDPHWISKRLGISSHEARDALARLERVGLLVRDQSRLQVSPDFFMAESGIPSEAVRNFHRQILERAVQSLDTQAMEDRDITGITASIDPEDLPKMKKEIRAFQDHLVTRYSKPGKRKEVYQIESALFRLSRETPAESAAKTPTSSKTNRKSV